MKTNLVKLAFAAMIMMPVTSQAQSLKSVLSGILGGKSQTETSSSTDKTTEKVSETASLVQNLLGNVLGNKTVKAENMVGTWNYNKPAIVFESSNVLNKLGGSVASNKLENKIATYLAKIGIKEGALSLTLNSDSTFVSKHGTKTSNGTYSVSGSTITFKFSGIKTVKANVSLSGSTMQITFKADKLLTFVQGLDKISTTNTTISTVTKLLKSYEGLQLGLQFKK